MMGVPDFSVVIPVYNERDNIPVLLCRLKSIMESLGRPYEVIFVNDGSQDDTLEGLKAFQAKDSRIKILDFARNFGHQAAVTAGLDHATGKAVIVMDGDLQDPPEVIPEFVARWEQGYDVVYAIRRRRKEGLLKRLAYTLFYRLLRAISDTELPLDAGDFSLMDRKIVAVLRQMPERNRFVRGLRTWVGFNQVGVEYERANRYGGEAKYTFKALLGLATSGFVSFSKVPLRLATFFGIVMSVVAFLAGVAVFVLRLVKEVEPRGWTSLMVVVLFLGGIQLITVGIVGEYVGHILDEVRRRPSYVVREWSGSSDDEQGMTSDEDAATELPSAQSAGQPPDGGSTT